MNDLTFVKNFIKFLTITFYHKFNTKKDYIKHLIIEYSLAVNDTKLDFLNAGNKHEKNIAIITIEYNKPELNLLNLSDFIKEKKELFSEINHVYLLSLKNEKLIPCNKYKVKECLPHNLFSLQFNSNTVYAIKLDDICQLINGYFDSLEKYFMNEKMNASEIFQLLDSLFQIADHYFESFKNFHLVTDYIFFTNFKYFKKHLKSKQFSYLDLDSEIKSFVKLINKSLTKTMTVTSYGKAFELYFKIKHKKSFKDILQEFDMFYDFRKKEDNYTFKNIKKFTFQDFILYLAILSNILSI